MNIYIKRSCLIVPSNDVIDVINYSHNVGGVFNSESVLHVPIVD